MVTLQLVSIWDLTAAMVLSLWVGASGFFLLRTIFRAVDAAVARRRNSTQVYDLMSKLTRRRRRGRRGNY